MKLWTAIDRLSAMSKSDHTDKIKRSFFPNSGHVDTAIWTHHMDDNKTYEEKASHQLHDKAACCIEQVLESTHHKTAALRSPSNHHGNYLS